MAHSHHSHHHDHGHDHGHQDHAHDEQHGHSHVHVHGKSLTWALLLTLLFAFVEVLGGWWSGSLALLSDAGHMFSDVAALGLAAFAQWVSRKPPSARHSYGLARAEVVAALLNGVLMLAVIVWIVVEAVQRLLLPHPVSGGTVMLVAFAGLAVNVFVALVLSHGEQSLNSRAALLHVMGDLLGSVAALIAGAVIHYTGWTPIDPLLSVLVAALILISTINLLRHALHALLDGVPQGLELAAIGRSLAGLPGVLSVHDLHVWSLGGERIALSAHMRLSALEQWPQTLAHARAMLHRDYRISHVTLQPETDTEFNTGFQLKVPIHVGEPTHPHH